MLLVIKYSYFLKRPWFQRCTYVKAFSAILNINLFCDRMFIEMTNA